MQLRIIKQLPFEIIHFYEPDSGVLLCSKGPNLLVQRGERPAQEFRLPVSRSKRAAVPFRIARRALRLDKMNAVFTADRRAVIAVYQGGIYRCDLRSERVSRVGSLRQCRNVLHCGISVTPDGIIYIGEYGSNIRRDAVPVWMSNDDGNRFEIIFEFPRQSIKHIHGVYYDQYTNKLWVPTGDFEGECYLYQSDRLFSDVIRYGNGNQQWRHVSLFFEPNCIVWGMDSQLQTSHLQIFDRRTGTLTQGQPFPGPVWYSKSLGEISILQTTREIGPGVHSDSAHLFFSKDNRHWVELAQFRKDFWPMRYFKFGVIGFADGTQSPDRFALFGEGLVGFDGVSFIASLR